MNKPTLDHQVAVELGKKKSEVAAVTYTFLQKVFDCLVENGEVTLDRLGKLRVVQHHSPTPVRMTLCVGKKRKKRLVVSSKLRVHFTKSRRLARAINEEWNHGEVRSR